MRLEGSWADFVLGGGWSTAVRRELAGLRHRGWRIHCFPCMRPSARGTKLLACPTPPGWNRGSGVLISLPGTAQPWMNAPRVPRRLLKNH